jgi:hypothetical protein
MLKTVFDEEDRAEIERLAIKAMPLLIAIPVISYWMTFEHRVHGSQRVILYYLVVSTLSLLASVMLGFFLIYQSVGGKKPHPLVVQYKFWIALCCFLCAANFLTIYQERSSLYLWSIAKLRAHKMMGPEADYARISQSVVSRRWEMVCISVNPKTGVSEGKIAGEIHIRSYEINEDGLQYFAADEVGKVPDGKTHFTYKNPAEAGFLFCRLSLMRRDNHHRLAGLLFLPLAKLNEIPESLLRPLDVWLVRMVYRSLALLHKLKCCWQPVAQNRGTDGGDVLRGVECLRKQKPRCILPSVIRFVQITDVARKRGKPSG